MLGFQIKTLGCKVNFHDSSLLNSRLKKAGFKEGEDVILFNTCAVTHEACKEALRQARKLKREQPNTPIVVTGCGAQIDTSIYENSPYIDLVIGNSHKKDLPKILKDFKEGSLTDKTFKSNIFKETSLYEGHFDRVKNRTRVFLKIQDGCDSFCTFCIIPYARGFSRSIPINTLVDSVKRFLDSGVEEIVLTGVHIGDYRDGDKTLEDLIEACLLQTSLKRLRLTSLEPIELSPRLMDIFKDSRMCPHFHLSIQSASSSVLKAMKRKYTRLDVEEGFQKIHQALPQAFVGMDVIAGFPDESQEDFEETYEVLKSQPWTRVHVFPYSHRRKMSKKPLDASVVKKRASLLRHLSESRFEASLNKQLGSTKKVLPLAGQNLQGLSRDYWKVDIPENWEKGEKTLLIQGVNLDTLSLQASFL